MSRTPQSTETIQPKTLIVGVQAPYNKTRNIASYYEEFINLVRTNGIEYQHELFFRLRDTEIGTFFTKGKAQEIEDLCTKNHIERVVISDSLTGLQERNLTDLFNCEIIDRTRLILEIFEKAALSAEGKTQVSIAVLSHEKTRLAGKGASMSQQAGFIGGRGPGERAKEMERRHIEEQIRKYKNQLEKIKKTRETQRKRRLESGESLICLIGYTNAGKSTILNALTKSDVLAEDKPFATLDTTTKQLFIDGKRKGLISDTVGFIQNLPHLLIDAFKATLDELQFADLLLHVVDLSDVNWYEHVKIVHDILAELNIDKPVLYVFNKADMIENIDEQAKQIQKFNPHVVISAANKKDIQPLIEYLRSWENK